VLQIFVVVILQELGSGNWTRRYWRPVLHNSEGLGQNIYKESTGVLQKQGVEKRNGMVIVGSEQNTGSIERLLWNQLEWRL